MGDKNQSNECATCGFKDCTVCTRLESIGLLKPFVRRMVQASWEAAQADNKSTVSEFRVTIDELTTFLVKTESAPLGTSIHLPAEVKFVVDDSMAQCIPCEDEVFEVQAKDLGWHYGTRLPNGESAWLCQECVRSDVDPPQF